MPHELTVDECRAKLLEVVAAKVRYWLHESRAPDALAKLNGLAHSLLATLDGSSACTPGFQLIPCPHPDDKEYLEGEGEDWWPDDKDVGGALHEIWHKFEPKG